MAHSTGGGRQAAKKRRPLAIACIAAAVLAGTAASAPAAAQVSTVSVADGIHAGEIAVPVNKSQVIRADRPYARALIGNPEIADILPLSNNSLYVLGKKAGTTSLTLYDRGSNLIAVVDVVVGPDVISLKRQLSQSIGDGVGARISNDSVVLEGIVSSAVAADRAVQLAETYAPGKVVNLLSLGSAQQVMLEVRNNHHDNHRRRRLDDGRDAQSVPTGAGRDHRQLRHSDEDLRRLRPELRRGPQRARAQGRHHHFGGANAGRLVRRDGELPGRRRIPGAIDPGFRRRGEHDHRRVEAVRG